MYTLIIELLRT